MIIGWSVYLGKRHIFSHAVSFGSGDADDADDDADDDEAEASHGGSSAHSLHSQFL